MNKLELFAFQYKDKKHRSSKWKHYFKIYDRHFKQFQGKNPVILEVGVADGGSLEMWNYYFDGQCQIYGVDINPACQKIEKNFGNIKVFIGSQNDTEFLLQLQKEMPPPDIIIDDGSHIQSHIIKTFDSLYNYLKPGGLYFVEDLHTAYWEEYGGGLHKKTFIEFSKNIIDDINSHYIPNQTKTDFAKTIDSLHYYDSICVIEKNTKHENPNP